MENLELRNVWAERVMACQASGQTAVAWCAANNLKIDQYKHYLQQQRKLERSAVRSNATPARWLPVEIDASSPLEAKNSQKTLLIKVGYATIEISPGFDPALLADVVRVLAVSC